MSRGPQDDPARTSRPDDRPRHLRSVNLTQTVELRPLQEEHGGDAHDTQEGQPPEVIGESQERCLIDERPIDDGSCLLLRADGAHLRGQRLLQTVHPIDERRIIRREMGHHHRLMRLSASSQHGRHRRDADASAQIPHKIEDPGGVPHLIVAPVFVTDTETVLLLPTVTLPKLALLGFAVREPAASPVQESAMLSGEAGASDTIASVPVADPAVVGAKPTLNVTLWFAASVTGTDKPLTEKPAPLTLACEMVIELPPVLVKVSDWLELLPI